VPVEGNALEQRAQHHGLAGRREHVAPAKYGPLRRRVEVQLDSERGGLGDVPIAASERRAGQHERGEHHRA